VVLAFPSGSAPRCTSSVRSRTSPQHSARSSPGRRRRTRARTRSRWRPRVPLVCHSFVRLALTARAGSTLAIPLHSCTQPRTSQQLATYAGGATTRSHRLGDGADRELRPWPAATISRRAPALTPSAEAVSYKEATKWLRQVSSPSDSSSRTSSRSCDRPEARFILSRSSRCAIGTVTSPSGTSYARARMSANEPR
jgi:hypothetical protein